MISRFNPKTTNKFTKRKLDMKTLSQCFYVISILSYYALNIIVTNLGNSNEEYQSVRGTLPEDQKPCMILDFLKSSMGWLSRIPVKSHNMLTCSHKYNIKLGPPSLLQRRTLENDRDWLELNRWGSWKIPRMSRKGIGRNRT